MFGIDSTELLVIAVVALIVIGPKDLPRVMRTIGNWVGRARGVARHFRTGFDQMMREAELQEMEEKWRKEHESIMGNFPTTQTIVSEGSVSGSSVADAPAHVPAEAPAAAVEVAPELPLDQPAATARHRPELP